MTGTERDSAPPGLANILVVDDHVENLIALEAVLAPLGQSLVRAASGEEALKALLADEFALIIMDVVMPGLGGFETADLIKQRSRTRNVPIIFVTAVDRDALTRGLAYEHGAVDFISKPYDPKVLCAKVSVFVDLYLQSQRIKHQAALLAEREQDAVLLAREQAARVEAERATKTRDDLLATVSHDLRNPLSAILTAVALMRHALASPSPSERAVRHLSVVERSATRMEVLIRDLLDISAIESGQLSIELAMCDPRTLVADGIELLRPVAEEKSIRLTVDDGASDAKVLCDRDRIAQVFGNIVGNAIKFTPRGGAITIATSSATDGVHFSITDTGPGIPAAELPRVFDRFWQAKETAKAGTGLGLSICRGIIEGHRGRIWVESTIGVGTTFHFVLPTEAS